MPDKRTEPGKSPSPEEQERARRMALLAVWRAVFEAQEHLSPGEIRKHVEAVLIERELDEAAQLRGERGNS